MAGYVLPKRRNRPTGLLLFSFLIIFGVIGTPIYIYRYGITTSEVLLFLFYFFATGMSITMGYHRFFSHASYKTNNFIRFLLLFFGAATFEQSALKWSSQHRQHHQFTDTDKDPHNSKRGFWYCHVGWIIFYKHHVNQDNVKDLLKNKLIMHQHDNYNLWSVSSGILLPMAIGFWIGHPLGAFIMAICLRMFLVLNEAFFINSYAHMVGKKTFNKDESARDHWFGAVLSNGEGYHSYHHRFPADYRSGIKWYNWDPTKWGIYLLSKVGLVWDLRRTSSEAIGAYLA